MIMFYEYVHLTSHFSWLNNMVHAQRTHKERFRLAHMSTHVQEVGAPDNKKEKEYKRQDHGCVFL